MVALRPIFRRLHYAGLSCGSQERSVFRRKSFVTVVELHARVDHLLLAKERELVRAQRVVVVTKELILVGKVFDIGVKLINDGLIKLCLGLLQ